MDLVSFAVDASYVIALLVLSFAIGAPFALAIPSSLKGRMLGATALGFAAQTVAITLLYRVGVAVYLGGIAVTLLATASLAGLSLRFRSAFTAAHVVSALIPSSILAATVIVLLLPKLIGGPQYSTFQANVLDQLNYAYQSTSVGQRSFSALLDLAANAAPKGVDPYASITQTLFLLRPSVNIVHEAFRPFWFETTTQSGYAFGAFTLVLMMLSVAFLLRAAFGATLIVSLVLGASFAVGFFGQYVFDINAWSQLAAGPVAVDGFVLVIVIYSVIGGTTMSLKMIVPLSLTIAGLAFLYPEMLSVYVAIVGVVTLAGIWLSHERRWWATGTVFLASALALLACVPVWTMTLDFLLSQLRGAQTAPISWFGYFDSYLFGHNALAYQAVLTGGLDRGLLLALPASILAGIIGLYWTTPPLGLPQTGTLVWWAALYLGVTLLACSALWTSQLVFRQKGVLTSLALVGAYVSLLIPIALVVQGGFWSGGKGLSYIWPFLFLLIVLPLIVPGVRPALKIAAAVFVALHLVFGIERIAASTNPDGITHHFPYPSFLKGKNLVHWDIERYRDRLKACHLVSINLIDERVDRYVQVYLSNLSIRWVSEKPVAAYFQPIVADNLLAANGAKPDCILSYQPGMSFEIAALK